MISQKNFILRVSCYKISYVSVYNLFIVTKEETRTISAKLTSRSTAQTVSTVNKDTSITNSRGSPLREDNKEDDG